MAIALQLVLKFKPSTPATAFNELSTQAILPTLSIFAVL